MAKKRPIKERALFDQRIAIQEWLRGRTGNEALLSQTGAFGDDEQDVPELRAAIYRDRGRLETEKGQ